MRIAALVIYQVVTLSGRNIFQLDGSGLCSKVLGILPRWSPQNRPYVVTSKPANEADPGQEYL
jgi:hypothetical protein